MMKMVQEGRCVFFNVLSIPNLRRRWMVQSPGQSKVQQGTRKECVMFERFVGYAMIFTVHDLLEEIHRKYKNQALDALSLEWPLYPRDTTRQFLFSLTAKAEHDCIVGLEMSSAEVKLQQSSGNLKKSVSLAQ